LRDASVPQAPLLAQLEALSLHEDQVALCWLGQAGYAIRTPAGTALIDPFLAPNPDRVFSPPFAPEIASGIDLILCTHDHIDHLDHESLPALAAASPQARVVVPEPIVPVVTGLGIDGARVTGMQPGEHLEQAGIRVSAVPAMHGTSMADAYSFGRESSAGLYRFLGFVLDAGGVVLYHAGDTIIYEGMQDLLRPFQIDIALLPINGRSPEREAVDLVGNLDEREAAHLASAIGAQVIIPMHHDMFAGNLGHPEYVVTVARHDYPHLAVLIPARFQPFIYSAVR
jgi:L-ascorbate metabolism protein UlaG (beta-lactamase superfamily)